LDEPQDKPSKLRRRAWIAAPLIALLAAVPALLLWPSEPKTAPPQTIVPAAATPPPPLAWEPSRPKPKSKPKEKPEAKPKRVEKPRPTKVRIDRRAANPVAVSVPSAGISAPTIALGLKSNGKIQVPKDFSQAGWREGGPEPGERGAAMITAHVDSRTGPGAFLKLDEVSRGDEIKVRRKDGTSVTFVAERTEQVPKTNFPTEQVYADTRLPTLRLVTCGGSFDSGSGHYRDNLIVYATRKAS
jgi:sortase (surface protein transpeptidase)